MLSGFFSDEFEAHCGSFKWGTLEKENKTLFKEIGIYKESCIRLKELEKENKELVKRATIDIKTLVTLREVSIVN